MRRWIVVVPGLFLFATNLAAQAPTKTGTRTLMPRDREIALARSAAPPAVSAKATIWILTGTGYAIAERGTSPVSCYVGRPWVGAVEPHCFDAEGSATIFPIQRFRIEQLGSGKADADVEKLVAAGIQSGRFRLPTKPAMTYMMSAAQELVNGQGSAVGSWEPHLMIYYPNLDADAAGIGGFVPGVGFVENPKQPFSAFVIPVGSFVPVDSLKR